MFTGIIQGIGQVIEVKKQEGRHQITVQLPENRAHNITQGASIAIDGVCLTVVASNKNQVTFDIIQETLNVTTLDDLQADYLVNVERSARLGDEVGGHLVSGHVHITAKISKILKPLNNYIIHFEVPAAWLSYILPKGFIAINGTSLTVVDVYKKQSCFSVHLIPETLAQTTFGDKVLGDRVNIEIEQNTLIIVDTVQRYLL